MGLACSNIRLLTLTARKADCEYGISIDSMHKMALSREMSELSSEYYSRLQSKQISYYANGDYYKMNYNYLMGYNNYTAITEGNQPLKEDNNMILTDFKGQVVLNKTYADAITSVLGSSIMDIDGRGGTFSKDKIPEIIAKLVPGYTAEEFRNVINGGSQPSEYDATPTNVTTGETNGTTTVDNTNTATNLLQKLVDFYYPIFQSAAANGWTTEYNNEMGLNDNYISDALVSGTFQLEKVDDNGNYEPDTSLTYFVTAGLIQQRTDSSVREEITAWYNAEKQRITDKENWYDIDIQDLSTELEAINTEIQSIQSLIDDAMDVFNFGNQ